MFGTIYLSIFYNKITNQTIKYYLSFDFLGNDNIQLSKDIQDADALYISGYIPDIHLIKKFNKPKQFIGNSNTIYLNENNNLCEILEHPKCFCYFSKLYYFDEKEIVKCENYQDFLQKINLLQVLKV